MKRGEVLFKAGQRDLGLAIVLRGELEAYETRDSSEYNLAIARERDFMGDVSMLQGTSILGSSRVKSDEAEILHIPAAELRRAGGNSRCKQDDRRCVDHATATASSRSRICGNACSGQPQRARWTSAR